MDNPHTLNTELAYIAGLIDGEGTITLERTGKRRMNGVMGLSPRVLISNTDESLIQFSFNMFRKLGVNPHIKMQDKSYKGRRRTCYWVTVQGLSKCKKILEPILPYLISKKINAHLLLDFIKHRGDPRLAKGKPYGGYELRILEQIRAINKKGVSETEDYGLRHKIM